MDHNGSPGVSQVVLDQFWQLASLDQSARVHAARQLIENLHSSASKTDESQFLYVLKRLIKGLSSGRDAARQGYALALTELVGQFGKSKDSNAAPEQVLEQLEAASKAAPGAGAHGQEERDRLFGLAFGCAALIRSGRLSDAGRGPLLAQLAAVLLRLASQKAFLAELAYELLAALLVAANQPRAVREHLLPSLLPGLALAPDSYTPERLGLLLFVRRTCADARPLLAAQLEPQGWHNGGALGSNLEAVAAVLKEATYTHPKQHSVWRHLLDALLADLPTDPRASAALLTDVWQTVGERLLLLPTASHPRKLVGLSLFEQLVERLPAPLVPLLFTRNMLRNLITDLADRHSALHAAARKALATLVRVATAGSGALRAAVLAQLTGPEGHPRFDVLTRTTAVADLQAAGLEPAAAAQRLDQLRDTFRAAPSGPAEPATASPSSSSEEGSDADVPTDTARANEVRREWVLDQLAALARAPADAAAAQDAGAVLPQILDLLVFHAFCHATPGAKANREQKAALAAVCADASPVGSRVQVAARTRLLGTLRQLSERGSGLKSMQHVLEALERLPALPGVQLSSPLPPEAQQAVTDARGLLAKLQAKTAKKSSSDEKKEPARELLAFEELLANAILLTYVDATEGADLLGELLACGPRLSPAVRVKGSGSTGPQGDEPDPVAVLMEVLLALLVRPSQLLRAAVEHAFRAFSGRLTPAAFEALLRAIDPAAPEDEPVLDEEASDLQLDAADADSDGENVEDDDEDDDESSSSSSSSSVVGAKRKQSPQQKQAQKKKNGEDDAEADEVSESVSDSDADSADLPPATDEEMLRADKKLEEMFRHMKAEKRARTERQRAALDHRFKALELLDAFARRHPDSPLLLDAWPRVLHALRLSEGPHRNLAEKLGACVRTRLARVHPTAEEVASRRDSLLGQLEQVVTQLGRVSARPLFVASASQILHALLRLLVADSQASEALRQRAVPALTRLATQVVTKRRAVKPEFLRDLATRHPALLAPALATALLQAVPAARNAFLRAQCITLAAAMLTQKQLLSDSDAAEATQPLIGALSDAVELVAPQAELGKKLHEVLKAAARVFQALAKLHPPADLQRLSRGPALVSTLETIAGSSASTALPLLIRDIAASIAPAAHARLDSQIRERKQLKQQQRRLKKQKTRSDEDDSEDAQDAPVANGHAEASSDSSVELAPQKKTKQDKPKTTEKRDKAKDAKNEPTETKETKEKKAKKDKKPKPEAKATNNTTEKSHSVNSKPTTDDKPTTRKADPSKEAKKPKRASSTADDGVVQLPNAKRSK